MDKAIKIDSKLYEQIKALAIKEGTFIEYQIRKAITNYLKSKKVLK